RVNIPALRKPRRAGAKVHTDPTKSWASPPIVQGITSRCQPQSGSQRADYLLAMWMVCRWALSYHISIHTPKYALTALIQGVVSSLPAHSRGLGKQSNSLVIPDRRCLESNLPCHLGNRHFGHKEILDHPFRINIRTLTDSLQKAPCLKVDFKL